MISAMPRSWDFLRFIRAWVANPRQVGAIAPSGAALAKLMTSGVDGTTGAVVELGAGTGVFTRALLERGVRESDLTLVENDERLAKALRVEFPAATLIRDAETVGRISEPAGIGAFVSGLPLLNMRPDTVQEILAAAFTKLRPGAKLFQFTYGLGSPVPPEILHSLRLRADLVGRAMCNVPPASVYQISRIS